MKKFSLTNKLSFLIVSVVIISVGAMGVYFDDFLKKNDFEKTQKKMEYANDRVTSDIEDIKKNLQKNTSFIAHNESMLASIELINNYQDKENYNANLLDEEKKLIANGLLNKVKNSLNNDIALYDKNEEIIAFVFKEANGFRLNFVSYENGEKVLYSKNEDDALYKKESWREYKLLHFKHAFYYSNQVLAQNSVITNHFYQNEVFIMVHQNIFDTPSKTVIAHLDMSYLIGKEYLSILSHDLSMEIFISTDKKYNAYDSPTMNKNSSGHVKVIQTDKDYISVANLFLQKDKGYFIFKLNKTILNEYLTESRKNFAFYLVIIVIGILLLFRFVTMRWLMRPFEALMGQIKKIEQGDYSHSKTINSGDELEIISKNINHLAHSIQEREKDLKKSQENFEYLSFHDHLTDLPNRRLATIRLEYFLELAKKNGTKAAIIFFDLDHFKDINDAMGHDVGDELIREIVKRLSQSVQRFNHMFARVDGDEFCIIINDIKEDGEIVIAVQTLLDDFKTPFTCRKHKVMATASIGIAVYPEDGQDGVTLLKNADLAMYRAKSNGRNRYSFYSQELSAHLEKRLVFTAALKSAIANGDEFFLVYQPKISITTGKIVSVEALIRWNSPELGLIRPDQFIKIAEETSLIIPIGKWVLIQACSDFVELQKEGYALTHVSINISSIQLKNSDLVNTLKEVIEQTHMIANKIELEITESYIATDAKQAIKDLQKFRDMGMSIAIDDFGTGYSSMSYLQKLPVTRLKIDKSFMDGIPSSQESIAIVKAILALATTFNLAVTAEGVETVEQVNFLQKEKCEEIQGYFYSKPLTLEDLKEYCKNSQ